MERKKGASIRNKYGHLECKDCGAIFVEIIDGAIWKCERCGKGGELQDLLKYTRENPDKLGKD